MTKRRRGRTAVETEDRNNSAASDGDDHPPTRMEEDGASQQEQKQRKPGAQKDDGGSEAATDPAAGVGDEEGGANEKRKRKRTRTRKKKGGADAPEGDTTRGGETQGLADGTGAESGGGGGKLPAGITDTVYVSDFEQCARRPIVVPDDRTRGCRDECRLLYSYKPYHVKLPTSAT